MKIKLGFDSLSAYVNEYRLTAQEKAMALTSAQALREKLLKALNERRSKEKK